MWEVIILGARLAGSPPATLLARKTTACCWSTGPDSRAGCCGFGPRGGGDVLEET
jgi:hypothetical protein